MKYIYFYTFKYERSLHPQLMMLSKPAEMQQKGSKIIPTIPRERFT